MERTLKIDEALYQKLFAFYTKSYQLPPLAAKIYAYLIFDFEIQGVTFEELVDVFKSSKSSVSSNLKLLQQGGFLVTISKMEERKRFFVINPDFVKIRFGSMIEKLETEMEIIDDLKNYRILQNDDESSKMHIKRLDIYADFLNKGVADFTETLKKLYH